MLDASLRLAQLLPLIKDRLAAGESVQFTPQGTSMRPTIYGGRDQVVLSPLPEKLEKYDLPLYRRDNGQFVLHRIVEVDQTYTCIGDNQFEFEPGVRPDQMIALATGFYRKGKYYSVDNRAYRLFCHIWHWSRPVRWPIVWLYGGITGRLKRIFHKKQEG